MHKKQSLAINAISNWAALLVSVIVGLFLTPYLISRLGNEVYGVWAFIGSVVGVYGLLDLGISSAVMRYVGYYLGKNDYNNLNKTISSAFFLFCAAGLFCAVLSLILPRPLAIFFRLPEAGYTSFAHSIWLIGLSTALLFLNSVITTTIRAFERFVALNLVRIATELLRVFSCLIALKMGWGLEGVAAATLLTSIASVVCNYVLFKICCSGASISSSFLDRGATIELMLFGLPAAVTIIAEILRTKLDTVVVAGFVDMGSVTIYAIAISLVAFFTSAMVTTSAVLDPRFSQLKGLEKNEEISRLYLRSVLLFTSMAFSIGLTLVWIGKGFIALWVGPGYENSYTILVILITGQMFAAIQMPTISVLFSLNRHRICAVLALLEGFCNLVLSILLVRKWGIIGVAVGTLIPMLVFKILLLPLCAIRELGLSARHYYVAISKPVILLITVSLLIRYVYVPADLSWPGVVVLTCGSVAVLAALANWLAVSQEYRFSANSVKNVLFSLFGLPERGRS